MCIVVQTRLLALLAATTDGCAKAVCEEYDNAFAQGCAALTSITADKEKAQRETTIIMCTYSITK